jgi:Na+/H+-dicarboxylate symporter
MKKIFNILTLAGFALGILAGLFYEDGAGVFSLIGSWYIKILKLFIFPVIFTSISLVAYNAAGRRDGIVLRTVLCFALMFTASFLVSSVIVTAMNPAGAFFGMDGSWEGNTADIGFIPFLLNLLPKNLSEVFINPKVFAIIIFGWLFGRIGAMFKKGDAVFASVEKVKVIVAKALEYFMYVTPVAVMCLMADTIGRYGPDLLKAGLSYVLTAYLCSVAVLILVMILPVWALTGTGPWEYVRKLSSIWIMTVTTCSSTAVLPYTVRLCREDLGIPEKITDVVVPLGCTINMCGGAVSFSLLGLFCAKLYGVSVGFGLFVMMLFTSLLLNMAAPGIPGGGIVIGASFLTMLGIPLGFIGFYGGIYKFLDMSYTTLNVTGDISANLILHSCLSDKPGRTDL